MISRTPTVSHAQGSVCPARSRAAATPEATSASAVRTTRDTSVHSRVGTAVQDYSVRSFPHPRCRDGESLAPRTQPTGVRHGKRRSSATW
jgi:hypothetical protein